MAVRPLKRQMLFGAAPGHSDHADAGEAEAKHCPGRKLRYAERIKPDAESRRDSLIVDILDQHHVSALVKRDLKVGKGIIEPVSRRESTRDRAQIVVERRGE